MLRIVAVVVSNERFKNSPNTFVITQLFEIITSGIEKQLIETVLVFRSFLFCTELIVQDPKFLEVIEKMVSILIEQILWIFRNSISI
jgi:hypothetical protein